MNYSTLCLLVAELEREQQATRKKRKAPSCRKCGKPMKLKNPYILFFYDKTKY